MTEQMAIEKIKAEACSDRLLSIHCDDSCLYGADKCEWAVAIQALEEIQQYRAIGTVEELKSLKESNLTALEMANMWCVLEDLKKYSAIGTIEEFKALKEKAEPKKSCPMWGASFNRYG